MRAAVSTTGGRSAPGAREHSPGARRTHLARDEDRAGEASQAAQHATQPSGDRVQHVVVHKVQLERVDRAALRRYPSREVAQRIEDSGLARELAATAAERGAAEAKRGLSERERAQRAESGRGAVRCVRSGGALRDSGEGLADEEASDEERRDE